MVGLPRVFSRGRKVPVEHLDAESSKTKIDIVSNPVFDNSDKFNKTGTFHIELPHDEDISHKGRWYHSTFHTITAMVGAGVLGLPFAMAFLGWYWGTLLLVYACAVSLYTSWLLVVCHEFDGTRMTKYLQLGRYAVGDFWGPALVVPAQVSVLVGTSITYIIIAGKSLDKAEDLIDGTSNLDLREWMLIFGFISIVVVQLPDFHSLWWVSLIGGAMSFGYCIVATIACFIQGAIPNVSYGPPGGGFTGADLVFGVFRSIGDMIFAFGGHSVLLAIQATLPSPSEKTMMTGVYWAYVGVAANSFTVATAGYWALGSPQTGPGYEDDILAALNKPTWMILTANLMVGLHMVAGYQVFSFTMLEQIEQWCTPKSSEPGAKPLKLTWLQRSGIRSLYVCLTTLAALLIPFFGDLMSFIGALGVTPLTFVLPSVFYLIIWRNQVKLWEVIVNGIIIVTFTTFGFCAAIGALRNLITNGDFTWDIFNEVDFNTPAGAE